MKTKLAQFSVLALAGFAMVAFSGCQVFRKSPSSAAPATHPVAVVQPQTQPLAANSGQLQSQGQPQQVRPTVPSSTTANSPTGWTPPAANQNRTRWTNYSVFNNLLDARSMVYSDATVLITNLRTEDLVIQISDRVIGVPDETGQLAVMVLPPGESFALRDYGMGTTTMVRALLLNDEDTAIGYLETSVRWPQRGRQWGKEMRWDILTGVAVALPDGPAPVKLPLSWANASANTSAVIRLQTLQQALNQIPALPAQPPASAPASAPATSSPTSPPTS